MRRLALFFATLPFLSLPGLAADPAKVHLLVAGVAGGRIEAGIAIDLPEGWKTYWRVPGDAGIPPSIEVGASEGLSTPVVRFPVPVRFDEAGLTAIGYTRSVVLPIDAALLDARRPGRLDAHVMIGLCHDICVPFEAHLTATIDPAAPRDEAAAATLAAARATVPKPHVPGATPSVRSVRLETSDEGPRVRVEVAMGSSDPTGHDLFVEGPTPEWALPLPKRQGPGGALETWTFAVDGLPTGATLVGTPLTFTLATGNGAVEQVIGVDADRVAP